MTVLVTRPAPDSETTVARLAERGISAIAAPALAVRFRDAGALPDDCRALIVTSRNAIRALGNAPGLAALQSLPVYAVGDRTADAARAAGFAAVTSAAGSVADLAGLLRGALAGTEGTLLHLCGRDVAGTLNVDLAAAGHRVERRVVYETVCAARLPDEATRTLAAGMLTAALFYSPKSATCFGALAGRAGLARHLTAATAVVMSDAVGARAREIGFGHTIVAENPNESALIAALERFLKDHRPT